MRNLCVMSGCYLYRAAVARCLDRLFCEEGNRQRSHTRCHQLLVRQLCGIGRDTYWNYLYLPESKLAGYVVRPDIEMLLRLEVALVKALPPAAVEQVLAELHMLVSDAIDTVRKERAPLSASVIIMRIRSRASRMDPPCGEQ